MVTRERKDRILSGRMKGTSAMQERRDARGRGVGDSVLGSVLVGMAQVGTDESSTSAHTIKHPQSNATTSARRNAVKVLCSMTNAVLPLSSSTYVVSIKKISAII